MPIETRGVEATLDALQRTGRQVPRVAARSINTTARRSRTQIARAIGQQIAVPPSYLSPSNGRLSVVEKASPSSLRAVIRARSRPTSLARYLRGRFVRGQGVTLEVGPGRLTRIQRAFPIRLRRGTGQTDTQFNLGLAIRLRPGERLANKVRQIRISRGLYLLYGPSVQQVFLDNEARGVAADLAPRIANDLEGEFLRQLDL